MTQFFGAIIWDFDRVPQKWRDKSFEPHDQKGISYSSDKDKFIVEWEYSQTTSDVVVSQDEIGIVVIFGSARFRPDYPYRRDIAGSIINCLRDGQRIEAILDTLEGEFALFVWDERSHTAYLAIDPMGHTSIYYLQEAGGLIWASHPQQIALWSGKQEINREAINLYLALKGIPAPYSIFSGIYKLRPGHVLTINHAGSVENEYWPLLDRLSSPYINDFQSAQEELRSRLSQTIKRYLEDETPPVGIFLSGGLDSTIVTSVTHRLEIPLIAFSVGYHPTTRNDERLYARRAADGLNVPFVEQICSPEDIAALLEVLPQLPEPVADATLFPELFLARHVKEKVSTILDGTGADALMGGSAKYVAENYSRLYLSMPAIIRRNIITPLSTWFPASRRWWVTDIIRKWQFFIAGCELPAEEREAFWSGFIQHPVLNRLLAPEWVLPENLGMAVLNFYHKQLDQSNAVSAASYMTLKCIMPWVEVFKLGRVSQLAGLSIRKPFLSPYLIEFGLSLPEAYKVRGNQGKLVLRQAYEKLIPPFVLQRPKANFSPPIPSWLKSSLKEKFQEIISTPVGIFNDETLRRMVKENDLNWRDWRSELWAIFILQAWLIDSKITV